MYRVQCDEHHECQCVELMHPADRSLGTVGATDWTDFVGAHASAADLDVYETAARAERGAWLNRAAFEHQARERWTT